MAITYSNTIDSLSSHDYNCATVASTSAYCTIDLKGTLDALSCEVEALNKKPDVDPEVKSTLEVCGNKLRAIFYEAGFKTSTKELIPDIKDVIVHNDCVVIVEFADGTTEKAVLHPEDKFSLEQGISICITKKLVGGSSIYNKLMERALKVKADNEAAKAKRAAEEKERKERAKKYAAKKAERKAKKREDYINSHKEAFMRAFMEIGAIASEAEKEYAD